MNTPRNGSSSNAVTHQRFEPDVAQPLWQDIVRHTYEMSAALKRDIRLVVAALDYLSNLPMSSLSAANLRSIFTRRGFRCIDRA